MFGLSLPELLSILSSLFGIIFSPLGAFLAWKSYRKAGEASERADVLSRRLTGRGIEE